MTLPRLYLAAPLFNPMERSFNLELVALLHRHCHVFLPQEDGDLVAALVEEGLPAEDAISRVYHIDIEAIRECDILLAILDGATVDEGVAFELGFARALGKTCVALNTDMRTRLPWGHNPMISGALTRTFSDVAAAVEWLSSQNSFEPVRGGTRGGPDGVQEA